MHKEESMDDTSREVLSLPEESASTPEAAPPPRHRIDQLASATDCEKFAGKYEILEFRLW